MVEIADWRRAGKSHSVGDGTYDASSPIGGQTTVRANWWDQLATDLFSGGLAGITASAFGFPGSRATQTFADRQAQGLSDDQDALAAENKIFKPASEQLEGTVYDNSGNPVDTGFRYSEGPPGSDLFGPGGSAQSFLGQTYNVPGFDFGSIPNADVYLLGPTIDALRRAQDTGINMFADPADYGSGGGGGGGGGGGRAVPEYIPPDRRIVEEFVRDKLIVLTGGIQPELQAIVDSYMADARKKWEGTAVDPKATVLAGIRGLGVYKSIHKLRQDFQDEDTWVGNRQTRLAQLGLSGEDAQERGVQLATAGTNINDIDVGKFQNSKGRTSITMLNRIEEVAGQIGRLL